MMASKTDLECLEMVRNDGQNLAYIDPARVTHEMVIAALDSRASSLMHVPARLKTREVCWHALKQDWYVLRIMPEQHLTPEMCAYALAISSQALRVVAFMAPGMLTHEQCLAAVTDDGYNLRYIPHALRTELIVSTASANR